MKKIVSLCLVLCLILSMAQLPIQAMSSVEPEEKTGEVSEEVLGLSSEAIPAGIKDTEAPEFKGITSDKKTVSLNEEIIFKVDATDNISGISKIELRFQSKSGIAANEIKITYDNTSNINPIEIPWTATDYIVADTYYLGKVTVIDGAGNVAIYSDNPAGNALELPHDFSFTVVNTTGDTTPPKVHNVTLDKTVITAPGTITITAEITDDFSGFDHTVFAFSTPSAPYQRSYGPLLEANQSIAPNIYQTTAHIGKYMPAGIYTFSLYPVYDKAGNSTLIKHNLSFEVINDDFSDITPPELHNGTVEKSVYEAPGIVDVYLDMTDDLSGVRDIYKASFYNPIANTYLNYQLGPGISATDFFRMELDEYTVPGFYILQDVEILDNAYNTVSYYNPEMVGARGQRPMHFTTYFEVINEGYGEQYAATTNSSAPDLKDIIATNGGGKIAVDYHQKTEISADIFEAAKNAGTDLAFKGEGIEWIFKGSQIKNPKPVDLSVTINFAEDLSKDFKSSLGLDEDTPAVVLDFPNNGELPGEVTMRVKADYRFQKYLDVKTLNLFYWNGSKYEALPTTINVAKDGYIEFTLTHNSSFIFTNISLDEVNSLEVEKPSTPGGSDGENTGDPNGNDNGNTGGSNGNDDSSTGGNPGDSNGNNGSDNGEITNGSNSNGTGGKVTSVRSSSRGVGSSTVDTSQRQAVVVGKPPLGKEEAKRLFEKAYLKQKNKADTVVISVINKGKIDYSVVKYLQVLAKEKQADVVLHVETRAGNAVQSRLVLPLQQITKTINVDYEIVQSGSLYQKFTRQYKNPLIFVNGDSNNQLNAATELIIKLPTTIDSSKVKPYWYNSKNGACVPLKVGTYQVDSKGYLHVTSVQAGDLIISQGRLTAK